MSTIPWRLWNKCPNKTSASFKQHSRLPIFFKEPEVLFLGRCECVETGGTLFDALEIKWTGDNFCRNLVIFHVIVFNLTYIVPHLLLTISYVIATYNTVLVRLLCPVWRNPFMPRLNWIMQTYFCSDKLKNINSFSWLFFYRCLTAVNIWKTAIILSL